MRVVRDPAEGEYEGHQAAVSALYPVFCEAIVGHRKDVVSSALALLLAEIVLLNVSEGDARNDAVKVAEAVQDNITRILLARAPIAGMMN